MFFRKLGKKMIGPFYRAGHQLREKRFE